MNDDRNSPCSQGGIDLATEARVVALVLGEASDFEEAELYRLAANWPEMRLLKGRLEAVNELLRDAEEPGGDRDWKLPVDLRWELLEAMESASF